MRISPSPVPVATLGNQNKWVCKYTELALATNGPLGYTNCPLLDFDKLPYTPLGNTLLY